MADPIDLVSKVLSLSAAVITLVRLYSQTRSEPKPAGVAAAAAPPPRSTRGPDSALYVIGLFVAATAALSLSAALFSKSDLTSLSAWSYLISGVIATVYAVLCVGPIHSRGDLRHLAVVCIAGLIPIAALPMLSSFRSTSGSEWIADSVNVRLLLWTWTFLAAAFLNYATASGDPIFGNRRRWIGVNAFLACLVVLALGMTDVDELVRNERARRPVTTAAGRNVDSLVQKLPNRTARLAWYQLASEAALSGHYVTTAKSTEAGYNRRNNAERTGDTVDVSDLPGDLWKSLSFENKAELLRRRLDFVHPVPKGEARYEVDLPGLTTAQRFSFFQNQMIVDVLTLNPEIAELYRRYQYPADVGKQIPGRDDKSEEEGPVERLLRLFRPSPRRPTMETPPAGYALVYGLPPEQAASALVGFYRDFAIEGYRRRHSATDHQDVADLIAAFDGLKNDRQPFLQFVVRKSPNQHLALLARLYRARSTRAVEDLIAGKHPPVEFAQMLAADAEFRRGIQEALPDPGDFELLRNLLNRVETALLSVNAVFHEAPLQFADALSSASAANRAAALAIIDNPVAEGVKELHRLDAGAPLLAALERFVRPDVPDSDREAILHNMARSIYRQHGEFALSWHEQIVDDAIGYGEVSAVMAASMFCLYQVLLAGLLGRVFGKSLVWTSFAAERLGRLPENTLNEQGIAEARWDFVGRDSTLDRLRRLSIRATGTIGLVGRRGIGKTRLMRELFNAYAKEGTITVWLDCPTVVSQDEFIQSISERMVEVVEARFAAFAGIPNYSQRGLDNTVIRGLSLCTGLVGAAFGLAFLSLGEPSPERTLASSLVAGLAIGLFLIRVSSIVMSTRDLQRNLGSESALFEWRAAYEALTRMTERLKQRRTAAIHDQGPLDRGFLGVVMAALSPLLLLVLLVIAIDAPWLAMGIVAALLLLWFSYAAWRRARLEDRARGSALSAASFTLVFRQFVLELAEHIRAGALGARPDETDTFVIFVDELDKIVDRKELRDFVRVIKSVFDIPGARFFLSISQDAYSDLLLGSALGKNEFDSSFDHIELVGPMSFGAARKLSSTYLESLSKGTLDEDVLNLIATLGKGVPRDILRRSDAAVVLAAERSDLLADRLLQAERNNLLSGVQYLAGLSESVAQMFTAAHCDMKAMVESLAAMRLDDKIVRVVSENLVYCHLLSTRDVNTRRALAEGYYEFLYSMPVLPLESIFSGLLLAAKRSQRAVAAD